MSKAKRIEALGRRHLVLQERLAALDYAHGLCLREIALGARGDADTYASSTADLFKQHDQRVHHERAERARANLPIFKGLTKELEKKRQALASTIRVEMTMLDASLREERPEGSAPVKNCTLSEKGCP